MENTSPSSSRAQTQNQTTSHVLHPRQITLIERALQQVGEFGEVRLVVEKGKLRYIEVAQSLDVLKLQDQG